MYVARACGTRGSARNRSSGRCSTRRPPYLPSKAPLDEVMRACTAEARKRLSLENDFLERSGPVKFGYDNADMVPFLSSRDLPGPRRPSQLTSAVMPAPHAPHASASEKPS